MWREQVAPFSAKYQFVIYDSRGHGETTAPADMDAYCLARDYVADKLALMDHLGIEKAYVGGLSMGGMIAQEFALQHPDRVKALLLFDTGPGMGAMAQDASRMAQFDEDARDDADARAHEGHVGDRRRDAQLSDGVPPARGASAVPDAARTHIESMKQMSVDGYLGGSKAMQDWAGTLDRLHEITVPTLVLVGEKDHLLAASRAIHSKIAGSRFVLLRNSGHGTNIWRADAFAAETLDFLAAVDAGEPIDGEFVVP